MMAPMDAIFLAMIPLPLLTGGTGGVDLSVHDLRALAPELSVQSMVLLLKLLVLSNIGLVLVRKFGLELRERLHPLHDLGRESLHHLGGATLAFRLQQTSAKFKLEASSCNLTTMQRRAEALVDGHPTS